MRGGESWGRGLRERRGHQRAGEVGEDVLHGVYLLFNGNFLFIYIYLAFIAM